MCGRYVLATPESELVALFDVAVSDARLTPRWNIAPTTQVPIVVEPAPRGEDSPVRRLESAAWGLVPAWAKDTTAAARAMNARRETVAAKPTFRSAIQRRRALVPADGWFEWHHDTRVPHFVHSGSPLAFAGLYEWWRKPDGNWHLSTTILTTDSIGELASLHARMPVVVPATLWDAWLDADTEGTQEFVDDFVDASAEVVDAIVFHPVDKAVGNVRNDSPGLISPIPSLGISTEGSRAE